MQGREKGREVMEGGRLWREGGYGGREGGREGGRGKGVPVAVAVQSVDGVHSN